MQAWFAYFFELPWLWKRQKNALRILLCIPGRNNVLLLFRGTTRIEKNNTTKHSWSVSFPTQARNVCEPYRPTEIYFRFPIQSVCSGVFPLSSPPNSALSRWRCIPVSFWGQESLSSHLLMILYLSTTFFALQVLIDRHIKKLFPFSFKNFLIIWFMIWIMICDTVSYAFCKFLIQAWLLFQTYVMCEL